MLKKMTLEEVKDIFINIEKKYKVYSLSVEGVYFWKLIRFELFDQIITRLKIINEGHPLSKIDKLKRLILLIKYSLLNLFKRKEITKKEVLLLTHGRKKKNNSKYIDIYLNDMIEHLKKDNKSILVIDRPDHYGRHYDTDYENIIYFERFGHIVREVFNSFFTDNINLVEIVGVLSEIESELESTLNIDIDLVGLTKKRIFRFKYEKKYFDKILDIVKPNEIFLVVSYGKEELIASAKERTINVTEVQHGVISSYHMGYYFPFKIPIPYFPDKIIVFGDYWKESVQFPCNSSQEVHSFNFIKEIEHFDNIGCKSDKILFISQGSIGDQLSKVAARFANKNFCECYYKLHPSEFTNWKYKYPELFESQENGFIKVISNEQSIYELLSICNISIGVYSTAIYESLMYGCKTFLVNIQGYQYMEYLIKNNYVKLLDKHFTLDDLLNFNNREISDKSYFYL